MPTCETDKYEKFLSLPPSVSSSQQHHKNSSIIFILSRLPTEHERASKRTFHDVKLKWEFATELIYLVIHVDFFFAHTQLFHFWLCTATAAATMMMMMMSDRRCCLLVFFYYLFVNLIKKYCVMMLVCEEKY